MDVCLAAGCSAAEASAGLRFWTGGAGFLGPRPDDQPLGGLCDFLWSLPSSIFSFVSVVTCPSLQVSPRSSSWYRSMKNIPPWGSDHVSSGQNYGSVRRDVTSISMARLRALVIGSLGAWEGVVESMGMTMGCSPSLSEVLLPALEIVIVYPIPSQIRLNTCLVIRKRRLNRWCLKRGLGD